MPMIEVIRSTNIDKEIANLKVKKNSNCPKINVIIAFFRILSRQQQFIV